MLIKTETCRSSMVLLEGYDSGYCWSLMRHGTHSAVAIYAWLPTHTIISRMATAAIRVPRIDGATNIAGMPVMVSGERRVIRLVTIGRQCLFFDYGDVEASAPDWNKVLYTWRTTVDDLEWTNLPLDVYFMQVRKVAAYVCRHMRLEELRYEDRAVASD